MAEWRRTHSCGSLTGKNEGETVILMGWVQRRRDHGGVIFVDLRDREGITQVVFNESAPEAQQTADSLRSEFVIAIKGTVCKRPEGMRNENLVTGEIEVITSEIRVLNNALTPPFMLDEFNQTSEDIRLKYRYLDLRRPQLQKNIMMRHDLTRKIREYLYERGFLDIETPFLTVSTPEGARDYLVPSRVNPGKFYALPQSPQQFKQLLMMSGFEKYFQIVRCFRDEDLRADRQPEFTQLDIEMSFADRQDVIDLIEGLFIKLFKEMKGINLTAPFPRMTYADAMEKYGHDAPDTRFEMYLKTINHLVADCNFGVFAEACKEGSVKAVTAKGAAEKFSRKDIDGLTDFVTGLGAKGLAYVKINKDGLQSPLIKFLGEELMAKIVTEMDGKAGDIIFFGAGETGPVNMYMSKLRIQMAHMLGLIKPEQYSLTWVLDFPLLEWDAEERRYVAVHHPFTSPMDEDVPLLGTEPKKARAKAYDLVLNGSEIGGGSIRIHRSDVQKQMFELMGFKDEELQRRFGYFVDALKYGTPPHGGIAFGIDRVASLFAGAESIRDVIAFPKTQKATDMMCDAPNYVDDKQLRELHIKTTATKDA
ncbi:MAG: aspartate--tRNA ligase [Deferribacteraceae bacterium]|nr:aspartate--tRNA ligase [Deferribacteraceae bacterium]